MKFYGATVEVRHVVTVQVAASDDAVAQQEAIKKAIERQPGGVAQKVVLNLLGESHLDPGTRITNPVFGPGVVIDLESDGRAHRVHVQFDESERGSKWISVPPGVLLPES